MIEGLDFLWFFLRKLFRYCDVFLIVRHCDMFYTCGLCRGLPALVDLATMRDVVCLFDKDPDLVNFSCPVNLIVDHSPSAHFNQRYV